MDNVVKASEKCRIKKFGMICGGNNQTFTIVILKKLEKRIQHSSNLSDIVSFRPPGTDCIKLVKEIHAACFKHGIENKAQLGSGFTHKLWQRYT